MNEKVCRYCYGQIELAPVGDPDDTPLWVWVDFWGDAFCEDNERTAEHEPV